MQTAPYSCLTKGAMLAAATPFCAFSGRWRCSNIIFFLIVVKPDALKGDFNSSALNLVTNGLPGGDLGVEYLSCDFVEEL
jgi:hypothetical protein